MQHCSEFSTDFSFCISLSLMHLMHLIYRLVFRTSANYCKVPHAMHAMIEEDD